MSEKKTLISKTYDPSINETTYKTYSGKSFNFSSKYKEFAFNIENQVVRIKISEDNGFYIVEQKYPDSETRLTLSLFAKGVYELKLQNGYSLRFISQANEIVYNDYEIKFKYHILDEGSNEVISLVEISIIGEKNVC